MEKELDKIQEEIHKRDWELLKEKFTSGNTRTSMIQNAIIDAGKELGYKAVGEVNPPDSNKRITAVWLNEDNEIQFAFEVGGASKTKLEKLESFDSDVNTVYFSRTVRNEKKINRKNLNDIFTSKHYPLRIDSLKE